MKKRWKARLLNGAGFLFLWVVLLGNAWGARPEGPALTREELANQANAPLSSIMQVRLRDTWIPKYEHLSGKSNLFGIDVTMPLPAYRLLPIRHLTRLTIPAVLTNPDHKTGGGDLRFMDLAILRERKHFLWGIGPTLVMPTADDRRFGQGKWQIGPAGGFAVMSKRCLAGLIVQNPMSVGGDKDRRPVNDLFLQPFVTYQLGRGWFVRSQPQIYFNLERGEKVFPVDFGAGNTFNLRGHMISWYVQPYWNFSGSERAYPRYGVSVGITFLFPNFWKNAGGLWDRYRHAPEDKNEE
ncbi:MAG: hypothetical protein WC352_06300 [Candidatus Omnitrophota bacterium]|jgi:hypothetical protein